MNSKKTNQKAILIISGYNNRGIIAFCRFCRENNILIFIIASDVNDSILLSGYKENVIEIRTSSRLTLDNLKKYKEKILNDFHISGLVILPSTEYLNRFILKNREELEKQGFHIPLCSIELYERLSDKLSFSQLCRDHEIRTPEEFESIESIKIPFVAKPQKYFTRQKSVNEKPILVTNKSQYDHLTQMDLTNFYFQEFIGGRSFYLLFYLSQEGTYSVYSQENLIQQDKGLSIIAAVSADIHLNKISSEYASLLLKIGFSGIIMIEVKLFEEQFYMIEANPRLWGPSQLILDSGMDLFDRFACDIGLIKQVPKRVYQTGKNYFWAGGIIEDREKNCATKFHNYEKGLFFDDYSDWCKADVYARPDSIEIYFKELNNNKSQ